MAAFGLLYFFTPKLGRISLQFSRLSSGPTKSERMQKWSHLELNQSGVFIDLAQFRSAVGVAVAAEACKL